MDKTSLLAAEKKENEEEISEPFARERGKLNGGHYPKDPAGLKLLRRSSLLFL